MMTRFHRGWSVLLFAALLTLGPVFRLTLLPFPSFAAETAQVHELPSGKVLWVYDGDTLEVSGIGKVRLIGIDAPEREPSPRDEFFRRQGIAPATLREIHREGLDFLIDRLKGERIYLQQEKPERDRHGRLLAYVILPDGRYLNEIMLEKGYAIVYRRFDFNLKADFLKAEETARRKRQGLWE